MINILGIFTPHIVQFLPTDKKPIEIQSADSLTNDQQQTKT